MHASSTLHAVPLAWRATQALDGLHHWPAAQSVSLVHVPRQAPPEHVYGAHETVAGLGVVHVPAPSHALARVSVLAPLHVAALHTVPAE